MRNHAVVVLLVGVLIPGLLMAGCGGGDDDGSSGSAASAESGATTQENGASNAGGASDSEGNGTADANGTAGAVSGEKAEFTAQANAICLKSNAKVAPEIVSAYKKAEAEGVDSPAEGREFEATTVVPLVIEDAEAQADGIGALEPPSGEEELVEAILDAYQAWIDKAEADPDKTAQTNDIFDQARELAGKYPLVKCGLSPFEVVSGYG